MRQANGVKLIASKRSANDGNLKLGAMLKRSFALHICTATIGCDAGNVQEESANEQGVQNEFTGFIRPAGQTVR